MALSFQFGTTLLAWSATMSTILSADPDAAPSSPPVLLTMASPTAALAAVRSLGRAGVSVTLADFRPFTPARWSRFLSRAVRCPDPEGQPEQFLDWLLAFGSREPGHVLLPTSDGLAWLMASRRDDLARVFRLYLPRAEAVETLVNKWRLQQACAQVGLDTPATLLPRNDDDLDALAQEIGYPLVVKPQTQVLLHPHKKGWLVQSPASLHRLYTDLRSSTRHHPMILARDPEVSRPLLQSFVGATEGVHDLTGFIDETGSLFVSAGARKLLQRPRRLGVGLCFQEEATAPGLAQKVGELCRRIGFHGMFDVEFVETDGRWLLIDFNPRLYGQLAFDVGRGLNLPWIEYLAAIDDRDGLHAAVALSQEAARRLGTRRYVNRIEMAVFLGLLALTGREGRAEVQRWWRWLGEAGSPPIDAILDADDWRPALAQTILSLWYLRHPRSALREALTG